MQSLLKSDVYSHGRAVLSAFGFCECHILKGVLGVERWCGIRNWPDQALTKGPCPSEGPLAKTTQTLSAVDSAGTFHRHVLLLCLEAQSTNMSSRDQQPFLFKQAGCSAVTSGQCKLPDCQAAAWSWT